MTNKEYEYIIEQQKEIIKQQKEIIDSLMNKLNNTSVIQKEYRFDYNPNPVYYPTANPKISPFTCDATGESYSETTEIGAGYVCIAPKNADCNKECDSCCYHAKLC